MKNLCAFLLSALLLIGTTIPVFASTDASDDLSGLTDEIVITANDLFADKLSRDVTSDDIDYQNAFKIFVGENIFLTDIRDVKEIPDIFGIDGYIYELPIYLDGDTLIVNIAKGEPLNEDAEFTEEEHRNILNNVGKWQVTAMKYYDNEIVNYETELTNKIGTVPEGTVLVGGLPYFRYAVALLPDDSGNIDGLVPLSDVPGIENISTFRSGSENIYNYQEVKEYIKQLPEPSNEEAGGYGFLYDTSEERTYTNVLFISAIFIVFVMGSVVVLCRVKRR